MNKIVNRFLLTEDKFMLKLNLKQPGFTYRACDPFTKPRKVNKMFKEIGDLNHIYKNE